MIEIQQKDSAKIKHADSVDGDATDKVVDLTMMIRPMEPMDIANDDMGKDKNYVDRGADQEK